MNATGILFWQYNNTKVGEGHFTAHDLVNELSLGLKTAFFWFSFLCTVYILYMTKNFRLNFDRLW